jgi:AAA ATPase domain
MPDSRPANPYDFRAPVRTVHLLAGRAAHLDRLDTVLRAAAAGRPSQVSIFGYAGCGKSSLLNAAAEIAAARGLLPITLALRGATAASELVFYREAVDQGLQMLIASGHLEASSEVIQTWLTHTRAGELTGGSDGATSFEIGLLSAAALSGKYITEVPVGAIQRDLSRLLALAPGLRGVVVCLDNAEYLDNSVDISQSLAGLTAASSEVTVFTSSEAACKVHEVAPRSWDQVEVRPFVGVSEVFEAMTKPLEYGREQGLAPDLATASDIRALTRGNPYEVNLVCHFIWEAIRGGEQPGFELSSAVIERLLAELEQKGRRESSAAITALARLSSGDYDVLARVTPLQRLTIHQAALRRLMFDDFDEEGLAEAEKEIRSDLQTLSDRGILTIEADRFGFSGGRDAALYAKYATRRSDSRPAPATSYARAATMRMGDLLGEGLVGDAYSDALIVGGGVPHELGGVQAGPWLNEMCDAARDGDLTVLSELIPFPFALERYMPHVDAGLIVCGLTLQIGVDEAEHVELIANVTNREPAEAETIGREWVESGRELFAKYDITVLNHRVHLLAPPLSAGLIAYSQLQVMGGVAFVMYRSGLVEEALGALAECVEGVEALTGDAPSDPLLRTQFADAYSRLAFMNATLGRMERASELLGGAENLALDSHWLRDFNRAYVAARQGDLSEATRLGRRAMDAVTDRDDLVLLHADFGEPSAFPADDPQWNVVEVHGSWVPRFVELQVAAWEARADGGDRISLERRLDGMSRSSPAALLRLAAWSRLAIVGDREAAAADFEQAAAAADLAAVDAVRREATLALGTQAA